MACPRLLTALILATAFPVDGALAQMPPAIAAPGEDIVATWTMLVLHLMTFLNFSPGSQELSGEFLRRRLQSRCP
jgi:hypothetical protein